MLIGARDPSAMDAAQKAAYDQIASGPRGGVPYPFLAMLDAPGLATAIQSVGAALRFQGALDDRLREVAILAAAWGSGYEWQYHERIARTFGITDVELTSIRDGSGAALPPVESTIVMFVSCAVRGRRGDQTLLARLITQLGRAQSTEIVAIAGYYPLLALFLSAGSLDEPMARHNPIDCHRKPGMKVAQMWVS